MNLRAFTGRLDSDRMYAALTFVLIYILMLALMNLKPDFILSKTVTTGGDMGSHFVLAQYLRDHLLPEGKLVGWYNGWQAGLPMFQYYFVPPYLLMVVLGYITSLEVAFKLVTIMWFFMLPPAAYLCLRAMGFGSPAPGIAASLSLCLLFLETVDGGNYSQWGGNIKSTLAGQFPYGISFALMVFSIGMLYKGYHDRRLLVPNAVLFALVALNHIYTTIIILLVSTYFLFECFFSKNRAGLFYLAKVFALGFMLAGFWYVPMAFKLSWAMPPKDVFYGMPHLSWVFIPEYAVFYVFALVGLVFGLRDRDRRMFFLVYSFVVVFMLLFACRYLNFLYVRFLPFLYMLYLMLAAIGVYRLTSGLQAKSVLQALSVFVIALWLSVGVDGLLVVFARSGDGSWLSQFMDGGKYQWYVSHGVRDIPGWVRWNYEGLEGKGSWPALRSIFSYMRGVNVSGRVDVEYGDYNYLGTPRVFEVMPVFTGKSVMEGLLFESSLTFPFFFYMQKTVSETSWWPGFPVRRPVRPDMERGLELFRLYNVQYFIVSSKTVNELVSKNPGYVLEKTINDSQQSVSFNFYRVNPGSDYVEYPRREPVLIVTDDWKPFSYSWIDGGFLDVPLAYTSTLGDYELSHFRIIVLNKSIGVKPAQGVSYYDSGRLWEALAASRVLDTGICRTESVLYAEELVSNVSCAGTPLLVKIPYFPNWQTKDAGRIYMASPSLMLVFPEGNQMRLYYGSTISDTVGWLATLVGLMIVLASLMTYVRMRLYGHVEDA
jgi:hypothetical protein